MRIYLEEAVGSPAAAEAFVLGANLDLSSDEREEIAEELQAPEQKQKLRERILGGLKHLASWEFVAGAGTGGAARAAVRMTLSGSFGAGIVAGAIGGGLTGGVREYISERRKVTAGSILERLQAPAGEMNHEQWAATVAKAEEDYKNA